MEDQLDFGGIASSKIPRFDLIPRVALVAFAEVFEIGIAEKGERAWNASRVDLESSVSTALTLDRLNHCIDHALKALIEIRRTGTTSRRNAGAIMFAGAVLAQYVESTVAVTNTTSGGPYPYVNRHMKETRPVIQHDEITQLEIGPTPNPYPREAEQVKAIAADLRQILETERPNDLF
jgi:hypothetical protein